MPVPPEEYAGSGVLEWELWERSEREEERKVEAEEQGAVTGSLFFSFVLSFVLSFVISLVRIHFSGDRLRLGRRAKGSLQCAAFARTADAKSGQRVFRHYLARSHTSSG